MNWTAGEQKISNMTARIKSLGKLKIMTTVYEPDTGRVDFSVLTSKCS